MSFRHTVLVITDSLGFPRADPEHVAYSATYIAQLKAALPECDIIHQGYGGATIGELYKRTSYFHRTVQPDLVIMQTGIVDCAPRALRVVEQQILSRLPLLGPLAIRLTKKYSRALRRWRGLTYTPLAAFAEQMTRFEQLYPRLCWIEILPATPAYEAKLDGIGANIAAYNAVLRRARTVATSDFTEADVMSDFHHLSAAGHHKLAQRLLALLRAELAPADEREGTRG
jgi:hypothetical protein